MPKTVLFDTPANRLDHLWLLNNDPLSLFRIEELRTELQWVRGRLDLPAVASEPEDATDAEWADILEELSRLPAAARSDDAGTKGPALDDRDRAFLAVQMNRALAALELAERVVDEVGSPTAALLPTTFPRRLEFLLGCAELPLVWVRRIDLLPVQI